MKKFSVIMAMLLVVALAVPTFASPFTDVPANHWAYQAINKLVAAGIIEGYPDGTYKGQNTLTRYEIAMVVARVLDTIERERELLADEVASAKAGLSTAQAEDVTAIVKALMEKNQPAEVEIPEGLTDQQAEEVANLIEALTFEYQAELKVLGQKIDGVIADVDAVEARVAALENAEPVVSFSGTYGVEFNNTEIEGDRLLTKDMIDAGVTKGHYYTDPFDVQSGWFVEDVDEDTNNDDGTPDYRLTDEEDYYVEDLYLENTIDLNVAVRKDELAADLNMVAFNNVFGGSDDTNFELDSLEGTITTSDFVTTIKDEQSVSFKDYLFSDAELDGVVVTAGDDVFFVTRTTKTIEESVFDLDPASYSAVAGDDDPVYEYDRNYLHAGMKKAVDFFVPMNVYLGYELAEAVDTTWYDPDNKVDTAIAVQEDAVKTTLVALDAATEFAGFDLTTDVAFNMGEDSNKGHLFRLGASGEFDLFDVAFNFENTKDMEYIEDDSLDATVEGFDVEVGTTLGIVEGSYKYEDYGTVAHTIKAAVPEGKVNFAGIAVDGSYELYTSDADEINEVRAINASTSVAGIELSYAYEYDVDNEAYDEEVDRVDNGDSTDPDEFSEEDEDVNMHTFAASYAVVDNITAGFTAEFEKAVADDSGNKVEFADEFDKEYTFTVDYAEGPVSAGLEHVIDDTTTITGRYTVDLFEAGFEKELDGDLVVDGKVVAPTLTVAGVSVDANAAAMFNLDQEEKNMEVNVDLSKTVSDKLALTGGFAWADKEIDVDFPGVKKTAGAGLEYKITDDVTASANYNFLDFAADSGEAYKVKEATAGISVAF